MNSRLLMVYQQPLIATRAALWCQHSDRRTQPGGEGGWNVKLFTNLSVLPTSRMLGAVSATRYTTMALCFGIAEIWGSHGATCSFVCGYQRFGGTCRFHLQGEVTRKMEAMPSSETLTTAYMTTRCHSLRDHDRYLFSHCENARISSLKEITVSAR